MAKLSMTGRGTAFLGYGACALAGCLWGTGFYFGRLALNEMSVEHMVLYRFLFACLGMLPIILTNLGRFRLTAAELRLLLLCSALGVPIQFSDAIPRPGVDHCQPRLAHGGRNAGSAGRRRRALCGRTS